MKLSATTVFLSFFLGSSLVSASPLIARRDEILLSKRQAGSQTKGAAFFMTNEPDGNFIISASIGNDGKLTLRQAANAVGGGAHGLTSPAGGPDPLFSQGGIKVSQAAGILATVNAGSNTVTTFSINKNDPSTLKRLGNPVSTGGEFPMSLAFNKAGTQLCVLNGGAVDGVQCFKVDAKKGLSALANTARPLNLNQTTPATGPAGTASHIIFSEDETKLIASVKGKPPQPGFLAVWDVAKDGSLSKDFQSVAPAKGGLLPFSLTNIPGKNALLATDAGIGFDIFDLAQTQQAKGTNGTAVAGDRNSANEIKGQGATCWSTFSPKTKNFYLTDIATSLVTEVSVDDNLKSTIVKQYPQGTGAGTIDNDIASIGANDFMYVLSANATSINVLSLDSPGNAKNIQKIDIAGPARKAGLTINGDNLQGMTVFLTK